VHVDLLTGRVWLTPTFKTATAETAAPNFVSSVFRDVGLPDVLVSDRNRDTRLTSAFWTGLRAALGSSPVFGSPLEHNTTGKVERINGVMADVLRSFANERGDDWPAFVPLVEFAINDSALPLGSGYTRWRGGAAARLMVRVTEEVRALLQECQARRKAEYDAHRRDVQFAVGEEVLVYTEDTPLPSRSLLSPRRMGPVKVLACPAPNTYRLHSPAGWRIFPEFNVERLRPYLHRPATLGSEPPPLPHGGAGRCPGARGAGAAQVQDALRPTLRPSPLGWLRRLWRHVGAPDKLTNCEEAISALERATGRTLPRPPPTPPGGAALVAAAVPAPLAPVGFAVEAAPPQRGTVARLCPRGAFSHVVAYFRQTSALRGTADSLLDVCLRLLWRPLRAQCSPPPPPLRSRATPRRGPGGGPKLLSVRVSTPRS
jgi:hypothetical protein